MHPNRKKPSTPAPADLPPVTPGSDPVIEQAFVARRAQRMAGVEPDYPASGSGMVAARLAQARARRDAPPTKPTC